GAYAAHSLLVVVEQTAAGFDKVVWPEEGFLDWFWKGFYLGILIVLWLCPLGLAYAAIGPVNFVVFAIASIVFLWLVFPISLLSSLSARSRWAIVRWSILRRLAGCWRSLGVFYGVGGLSLLGLAAVVFYAVAGWRDSAAAIVANWPGLELLVDIASVAVLLPLAGLTLSGLFLQYRRLLGRLGVLMQAQPPPEPNPEEAAGPGLEEISLVPSPKAALDLVPAAPNPPGEVYVLASEPPAPPVEAPFRWQPGQKPPPAPPRSQWRDQPGWSPPAAGEG